MRYFLRGKTLSEKSQSQTVANRAGSVAQREPQNPDDLVDLVYQSLDEDKAENIIKIDLRGKSAVADYMVIASGRSQRHVGALSDHLMRQFKNMGIKQVQAEGLTNCDWVLVDTGDIVVHLFRPEVREFYNLEKMWLMEMPDEDALLNQDNQGA